MIRDDLRAALGRALARAELPEPPDGIELEPARSREHGDWASNVAMKLAKVVGANPKNIAQTIKSALEAETVPHLARVEIAGQIGVSLPTAHRITAALAAQGYLARHPKTLQYSLGPAILRLSNLLSDQGATR